VVGYVVAERPISATWFHHADRRGKLIADEDTGTLVAIGFELAAELDGRFRLRSKVVDGAQPAVEEQVDDRHVALHHRAAARAARSAGKSAPGRTRPRAQAQKVAPASRRRRLIARSRSRPLND